jgi:thioesterase domain-containing protein
VTPGDAPFDAGFLSEAQQFLHQKIPITRAMGVRVESIANGEFILVAPIEKNHNHLHTAFGGSLSAMATLAGYGFLWLELHDPGAHVVIKESAIRFRRPVHGDIRAVCRKPEAGMLREFKENFARKGKGRIELKVEIVEDDTAAVEFRGTFVAVRDQESAPHDITPAKSEAGA